MKILKFPEPRIKWLPKLDTISRTLQADPVSSRWCNRDTCLNHWSIGRLFGSLPHIFWWEERTVFMWACSPMCSDSWCSRQADKLFIWQFVSNITPLSLNSCCEVCLWAVCLFVIIPSHTCHIKHSVMLIFVSKFQVRITHWVFMYNTHLKRRGIDSNINIRMFWFQKIYVCSYKHKWI